MCMNIPYSFFFSPPSSTPVSRVPFDYVKFLPGAFRTGKGEGPSIALSFRSLLPYTRAMGRFLDVGCHELSVGWSIGRGIYRTASSSHSWSSFFGGKLVCVFLCDSFLLWEGKTNIFHLKLIYLRCKVVVVAPEISKSWNLT